MVEAEEGKMDGILLKLENMILDCSEGEKKIATFILENAEEVVNMSIYEFADKIDTSTASVSRFVKRVGMKNYADLKNTLLKEIVLKRHTKERLSIEEKITWNNSYADLKKQLVGNINEVCNGVLQINSDQQFDDVIEAIRKANILFFFALGSSVLAARDLQHKVMRLGKRCIFLEDVNYGLQNVITADERDLLIIVSFDGSHGRIIEAAKQAKMRGVKLVSITKVASNRLMGLADYSLYIPNIAASDASLSSLFRRYGQLTVVDMLYIGLAKRIYPDPAKAIEDYNEQVKKLTQY